jgi:hypothetical protein
MRTLILSTILLLSGCSGLNAAPPAKHAHANKASETATVGVEVVFSDSQIKTIRAYYEGHGSGHAAGKGKGKHKQKSLPPGIAKNLARGKPLPPGIAKRSLPYDLSRQLPPTRSGYEIIVVAGKVLLIEVATQIVRDVLTDALFS